MLKKMKIKSQVIFVITIILTVVIILQIFLYFTLQNKNKEIVTSIFYEVAKDSAQQIENLNEDVAEIASLLSCHSLIQESLYEYTASETVKNLKKIYEVVNDYRVRNHNICSLNVVKEHNLFVSSESVYLYNDIIRLIQEYTTTSQPHELIAPSFVSQGHTYFSYILPVYSLNASDLTAEHPGNYIICIYEMNIIGYSPYPFIDTDKINTIITDNSDKILYSFNPEEHGTPLSDDIKKSNMTKSFPIPNTDWNAIVFMPNVTTASLSGISNLFLILMILFNIIMLILMIRLLNGTIVKRILLIKDAIGKILTSDEDYCVKYEYDDELSEIVAVVNHILKKINKLNKEKIIAVDNLYKAQLLQKETQICYLYGQISPHFLYNSMSCIQNMAVKCNATEIVGITASLSKIFRYFSNNLNVSTIKQDIDHAIEYFNIVNMRRQNPITLKCDIDENIYHIKCLKMIYQPILENVLKHAFPLNENGLVTITSIPDDEKAIIEIADNGKGIADDILKQMENKMSNTAEIMIQSSEHIGLLNVHMRLKLFYDETCGIKINSVPGSGTKVTVIFNKKINESRF